MSSFKEQQAAEAEQEAFENFKLNFKGGEGVQVEDAYAIQKAAAKSDEKDAAKVARPDKAQLGRIGETLQTAISGAARFRNGEPMTDDEKADVIAEAMAGAGKMPAALAAALKEEVTRRVDEVRKSGDVGGVRDAVRAAAYKLAQSAPRTWVPETDSAEDTAAILAAIPRA